MASRRHCTAFFLATLCAVGCGMGLPIPERIASLRPLALRVEVDDPGADPDAPRRTEALPLQTVEVTPFFVDTQLPLTPDAIATGLEPVWLACTLQPLQGLFGCLSEVRPLDPAAVPPCPIPDPAALPGGGELPVAPSPCLLTEGTPGQPRFTVPLDPTFLIGGDVELTMVAHLPGEGDTATCLAAILDDPGEIPPSCLFATQRIAVGPDAELVRLAAQFGLPTDGLPPVPDEVQDPDTHPRIQSFEADIIDDGAVVSTITIGRGDTIDVALGQTLDLRTSAPVEDLQTYFVREDQASFVPRSEVLNGLWFRTWGDLLSDSSDDLMSINQWTMLRGDQDETDRPANDLATMFYVLRDDRTGVDWWWFRVRVSP